MHTNVLERRYCLNNQLVFTLMKSLGPGQYMIAKSFAPMLAAILLRLLYNEALNELQWLCILLSVSGLLANQTCVKVECSEYDEDNANTSSEASKILLFISCLVSACTAVFNAKFLKNGKESIQVNQMLLYGQGFVMNLFLYVIQQNSESSLGFFYGFGNPGVIMLLFCQSMIGVAISYVYFYGGAMVKTLATVTQSAILTVLDAFLFGIPLSVGGAAGATTVITSSYIYFQHALKK